MCLQGLHSAGLVRIADGDQLVRVAATAAGKLDYFAETTEVRLDVPEGLRIQVQKGDAERKQYVDKKHINGTDTLKYNYTGTVLASDNILFPKEDVQMFCSRK